jgi:hypothetical protein
MNTVDHSVIHVNQTNNREPGDNETDHRELAKNESGEVLPGDDKASQQPNNDEQSPSHLKKKQPDASKFDEPGQSLVEYDPFITPPDLKKAENHLKASSIALDPKNKEDIDKLNNKLDSEVQKIKYSPVQQPTTNGKGKKVDSETDETVVLNGIKLAVKSIRETNQKCKNDLELFFIKWQKEENNKREIELAKQNKPPPKSKTPYSTPNQKEDASQDQINLQDKTEAKISVETAETCPCCERRVKNESIKFTEGVSQIGNLGAGYVLFFKMNLMVNFVNIVNLILCMYPIIRNAMSSSCKKEAESLGLTTYAKSSSLPKCHLDFVTITSLPNYDVFAWDIVERVLLIISMFSIVLMSCFWKISITNITNFYENKADGPDDWTVLLKNIAPEHAQKIFIRNDEEEPIKNLDDYVKALINNCRKKTEDELNEEENLEKNKSKPKKNEVKPINESKKKPSYEKVPLPSEQQNIAANNQSSIHNIKPAQQASDLDVSPKRSSAAELNNSKMEIGDSSEPIQRPEAAVSNEKYAVVSTNYVYRCTDLVELDKNLTQMKRELRKLLEKEPAKDKPENEKLKDMLNPLMNKKQFLGQVGEGVDNQINLDDFSLEFQIKFTKALFVSRKVSQPYTAFGYSQ